MTHDEMIAVITAHKNGKSIECSPRVNDDWSPTSAPIWNFGVCNYRIAQPKRVKTSCGSVVQQIDKFVGKRISFGANNYTNMEYPFEVFGKFEAGTRSGIVVRSVDGGIYSVIDIPSTEIAYQE